MPGVFSILWERPTQEFSVDCEEGDVDSFSHSQDGGQTFFARTSFEQHLIVLNQNIQKTFNTRYLELNDMSTFKKILEWGLKEEFISLTWQFHTLPLYWIKFLLHFHNHRVSLELHRRLSETKLTLFQTRNKSCIFNLSHVYSIYVIIPSSSLRYVFIKLWKTCSMLSYCSLYF